MKKSPTQSPSGDCRSIILKPNKNGSRQNRKQNKKQVSSLNQSSNNIFASSTIVSVIFKRECMPTWSLARVFESEKQKYAHVKTLLLHKKKEEFLPEDIVLLRTAGCSIPRNPKKHGKSPPTWVNRNGIRRFSLRWRCIEAQPVQVHST